MLTPHQLGNAIWDIADLFRSEYKQSDYGKVVLPIFVRRRLDAVLVPTKDRVLVKLPDLNPEKPDSPRGRLALFGQKVNPKSSAICKADMLLEGEAEFA